MTRRVRDLFLSLAQMETEKLQSVNLAEEDELFLNFSAAQVNDRIYKSFDFNFVSFSFFQQLEWQTQCYDVNWPRCEGGGTLPPTTSEDASRSWGMPLPLVILTRRTQRLGHLSLWTQVASPSPLDTWNASHSTFSQNLTPLWPCYPTCKHLLPAQGWVLGLLC